MNVSVGAKTHPGQRPNNEDRYATVDVRQNKLRADGVLIVADGMGGRNFGERASETAVQAVQENLVEMLASVREDAPDINDALASSLRKANARVYEMASGDEEHKGMGTTCVAAVIEGEALHIAHAGDSRAYLWRDGSLKRLTDDHSYVAEQVRAGAITEEGARRSRFRNVITKAVGIEPTIEPDVNEYEIRAGDGVLLCTDGLTNAVSEDDIAQTFANVSSAQTAADKLVQMANKNGGKDNITAIVARLESGTRTLRMQTEELARPAPPETSEPSRNGAPAPRLRRRSPVPALLSALLILGLGTSTAYFAHLLLRDGYRFRTDPPFVAKPAPPRPPAPPDLVHLRYALPVVFYYAPVRGDLLLYQRADNALTVATLTGTVLRLSADGKTPIFKYALPQVKASNPLTPSSGGTGTSASLVGGRGQNLHVADDPQGNIYVADAAAQTITKYAASGEKLATVASSGLKSPQSLAVAEDGTVYVVDAERLKVMRAIPSSNSSDLPAKPMPTARPGGGG